MFLHLGHCWAVTRIISKPTHLRMIILEGSPSSHRGRAGLIFWSPKEAMPRHMRKVAFRTILAPANWITQCFEASRYHRAETNHPYMAHWESSEHNENGGFTARSLRHLARQKQKQPSHLIINSVYTNVLFSQSLYICRTPTLSHLQQGYHRWINRG